MTTATRDGRRLRLEVEGIETPYLVDPISAIRGRYLTDQFVRGALEQLTAPQAEAIFIEAFGPANYARATGFLVDQFEDSGEDVGNWRCTWGPHGMLEPDGEHERLEDNVDEDGTSHGPRGLRFIARIPDEPMTDVDELRQEEVEALALIAFYWQTVAGMEAVQAFIAEGEGSAGSVKALGLLLFRLGLSQPPTSLNTGLDSLTQQDDSADTNTHLAGVKPAGMPGTLPLPLPEHEPAAKERKTSWFRR